MHSQRQQYDPSALSGGVFLVGLGLVFLTGWWWPGILLVVAAAAAAKAWAQPDSSKRDLELRNAGIFALLAMAAGWNMWPLLLVGVGVWMLVQNSNRPKTPKKQAHWQQHTDDLLRHADTMREDVRRAANDMRAAASEQRSAAPRRTNVDGTAFDELSPIYDPARDAPGPVRPVEAPSNRPFPTLADVVVDEPGLAASISDQERRLDRARRGDV